MDVFKKLSPALQNELNQYLAMFGRARESERRTDLFLSLQVDKLAVKETEESRDL